VVELADKTVRNRTTEHILSNARTREDLKRELEQTLKKLKPAHITDDKDADALLVTVKSYLSIKLK
jgi:hypothetical protein